MTPKVVSVPPPAQPLSVAAHAQTPGHAEAMALETVWVCHVWPSSRVPS